MNTWRRRSSIFRQKVKQTLHKIVIMQRSLHRRSMKRSLASFSDWKLLSIAARDQRTLRSNNWANWNEKGKMSIIVQGRTESGIIRRMFVCLLEFRSWVLFCFNKCGWVTLTGRLRNRLRFLSLPRGWRLPLSDACEEEKYCTPTPTWARESNEFRYDDPSIRLSPRSRSSSLFSKMPRSH